MDGTHGANKYYIWACEINKKAQEIVNSENGDEPNPYNNTALAAKLLGDCKMLWSSVARNHFGYGRVPAISAVVEADFNVVKTVLLKKCRSN